MSKETVEVMVEGGKASAGAQMGQALGPLGIDIQSILSKINEKTSSFSGMKVPVKINVDTETKEFDITVGTPPISELIKKELNLEKGAGQPNKEKLANIAIEQIIKIAKMKQDSMIINNFKSAVKSVIGSCNSLGILIEGKTAKEINNKIDAGSFDEEINAQKTELSEEKKQKLEQQFADIQIKIQEKLEKEKAEEAPKEEVKEGEEEKKEGEVKEGEEEAPKEKENKK